MNELLNIIDRKVYDTFCGNFNRELGVCNGDIRKALYNIKCRSLGDEDGGMIMISYLLGVEHAFRYIHRGVLKKKEDMG